MAASSSRFRSWAALFTAGLLVACSQGSGTSSGGGQHINSTNGASIRLSAFGHFNCSPDWTTLDGAMGLRKGAGNGSCTASFPGPAGTYRVELAAQTEYDGNSSYAVGVNQRVVHAGMYPLSTPTLQCDCPDCPDKVVMLGAGVHKLNTGDTISFMGQEIYACGTAHGASAKWHELVFTRID